MMKKIALSLTLASLFVFTACVSEGDNTALVLNEDELTLYYEDETQLTADDAATIAWHSEDEFVASVDEDGLVTAEHVGQTFITATTNDDSAQCMVEVKPQYHTYVEPVFDFGASKSSIQMQEYRTLERETEDALLFSPDSPEIEGVAYVFENGRMSSSAVFVNLFSSLEATKFLMERYLVVGANEDAVGIMLNNLPEKANMGVVETVEDGYVMVMYLPYDPTDTRSVDNHEAEKLKLQMLFKQRN
jgi:hypothetical protein